MKKLSKTQQEVIALMSSGWELGVSNGFDGRCWLQEGGCGKGGHVKPANSRTVNALREAGLIEAYSTSFPTTKYRLRSNA